LIFENQPQFNITGKVIILNCYFDINGVNDLVFFTLHGGEIKCDDMVVNPFSNSKFLNSDDSDISINCFNLKFEGAITSVDHNHFTFVDGISYFIDCV
jgi:hypothetical protein